MKDVLIQCWVPGTNIKPKDAYAQSFIVVKIIFLRIVPFALYT